MGIGHKITTTPYDELSEAEKFARNQNVELAKEYSNKKFSIQDGFINRGARGRGFSY